MQTGTFYVASSVKNVEQVNACADELILRGMRWANNYAWTDVEGDAQFGKKGRSKEVLRAAAASDVSGAVAASVFVALMVPGISHRGTWLELGARLGQNREAHVVLQGYVPMFFLNHPCVVAHGNWSEFMLALFPNQGYISSMAVEPLSVAEST